MKKQSTDLTTIFNIACIPDPVCEYRFDTVRRWRLYKRKECTKGITLMAEAIG